MQLVSTDVVRWREELCRQFLRLDFEPSHEGSFRGSIEPILAGDGLRLARFSHSSGTVLRSKSATKDGNDDLVLLLATRTAAFIKQGDRETRIGIGQAAFIRNGEIGRAASKADNSVFALMLDPKTVDDVGESLYGLVGQALPRSRNVAALRSYLVWLNRNRAFITPESSQLFGRQLVELVKLCASVDASADGKENDLSGARIRLANDFISQNFQDSCLSEKHLAAHQGISARYLQKLFARNGTSFSECLSECRLQAARKLLESPKGGKSIIEVALAVGYNDLSNFHRMFKRKFGETPGETHRRWQKESACAPLFVNIGSPSSAHA